MKKRTPNKQIDFSIVGDGNIVGDHNSSSFTKSVVSEKITIDEFMKLLQELNIKLETSQLDENTKNVLKNDVDEIEKLTKRSKPNGPVIISKLKSIKTFIKSCASVTSSVMSLMPLIEKALVWAKNIF